MATVMPKIFGADLYHAGELETVVIEPKSKTMWDKFKSWVLANKTVSIVIGVILLYVGYKYWAGRR